MALVLPTTKVEKKFSPIRPQSNDGSQIFVQIAGDHRKHTWAGSVFINRMRSTRACGMAPLGASQQTLLAIALISSLRSVTKGHVHRLIGDSKLKPVLNVMTNDENFAATIRAFAAGTKVEGFKFGRNFLHDLHKQLRRFHISVDVVPEDNARIAALRAWSVNTVHDSRKASEAPPVFQPSAVSVAG